VREQSERAMQQTSAAIRMAEQAQELSKAILDKLERIALQPPPVQPRQPQQPLQPVERSDLDIAIELQATNDPSLSRHLHHWAAERKLEGMDETELINHILHWPSSEDEAFEGIR